MQSLKHYTENMKKIIMPDYSECAFMLFSEDGNALDAFAADPYELIRWASIVRGSLSIIDRCEIVTTVSSSLFIEHKRMIDDGDVR